MFTIRKIFKFEMAHQLDSAYSKECTRIHGHSYKMEIIIKSYALNQNGMVIDFKRLKEIVNEKIIAQFDHQVVISYLENVPDNLTGAVEVGYNPTAENMAKNFAERLYPYFMGEVAGFLSLEVVIHETDTGYASYLKGAK